MKKRRIKKKPIIIITLILLVVVAIIVALMFPKEDTKKVTKIKNVDTIEEYGYTLSENATKYYKKLFKELKGVLSEEDVDEEAYASLVSKLFVADFFSLDNKISKNDVGGVQFVYNDFRPDFVKLAETSMYKHVESDIYGERKQELPIVTSVVVEKKENAPFTYGDKIDENAYVYDFSITYENDLGYQSSGTIVLIHNDKKLEIAAM